MVAMNPHLSTIPEAGEVMLLTYHQDKGRWRPAIYIGPPEEPNKASELFLGEWRNTMRKAIISGLKQYFNLYLERYGFRHPEDPYRTPSDGPLPANVISIRTDEDLFSHTADEMPSHVYL